MRCGDLDPGREVYKAPGRHWRSVHLRRSCQSLANTEPVPRRAGSLPENADVCRFCSGEARRPPGKPQVSLADVLADPDFGPIDLGLSGPGER